MATNFVWFDNDTRRYNHPTHIASHTSRPRGTAISSSRTRINSMPPRSVSPPILDPFPPLLRREGSGSGSTPQVTYAAIASRAPPPSVSNVDIPGATVPDSGVSGQGYRNEIGNNPVDADIVRRRRRWNSQDVDRNEILDDLSGEAGSGSTSSGHISFQIMRRMFGDEWVNATEGATAGLHQVPDGSAFLPILSDVFPLFLTLDSIQLSTMKKLSAKPPRSRWLHISLLTIC